MFISSLSAGLVVFYLSVAVATAKTSGWNAPLDVVSVFELDHGVTMASPTTEPTFHRIVVDVETGKVAYI